MGGDTSEHRLYKSEDPKVMRENVREAHQKMVVRLQDELERLIKIYAHMREAMENEMFEGMGYKKLTADGKVVRTLKDLTIGMNSLVETRIKWDRAQAKMAETMTPEQEMSAVVDYIVSLESPEYRKLQDRLEQKGLWKTKVRAE